MAAVYKRTQDRGKKRACWYVGYTDHTGKRCTRKGFTDKGETERLAAKLEENARLIREGLREAVIENDTKTPLAEHLEDFEVHLRNRDVSEKQVYEVTAKVRRIIDGCGFTKISDFEATDVENLLGVLRSEGMSKQTSNHYLRSANQFCRWLVRTKRADVNPLADVPMLNVQTDRRHDRRPLLAEEFGLLVAAAVAGSPIESIPGTDRAMMYIISAWTGYRKGEIGSLTLRSFDLEGDPPTLTVQAVYSKRKRTDTQVLHPDVVERLKSCLATKPEFQPHDLLFPVSGKVPGGIERKTLKMMKSDLNAARKVWIESAETEKLRAEREKLDFLKYRDSQGRYADFHANRHTFITNLGRAGVIPKTAQTLARHSDIRLTMNVYSHTDLAERADAVRRLPGLWEHSGSAPESQDGTDGQSVAQSDPEPTQMADPEGSAEMPETEGVDANCQSITPSVKSTPGRARTYNLRFRRPMLYPIELRVRRFFAVWFGRSGNGGQSFDDCGGVLGRFYCPPGHP